MNRTDRPFSFAPLETTRTFLRVLTRDDAESLYRHFSDDEVTRFMDIDSCTCLDDALEIIDFHQQDSGCRWGIIDSVTRSLIGTCGYHCWDQDRAPASAEIGFDLGKAYWGKGLMREVLLTVIPFGFHEMGLHKIEASVEPKNQRSIHLLTRIGFQGEHALRDELKWFSLINEDGFAMDR